MESFSAPVPNGSAILLAGALAHLTTYLSSGCPKSAYLAALVLRRVEQDGSADGRLQHYAGELAMLLAGTGEPGAVPST